jgi:hypothetical protein
MKKKYILLISVLLVILFSIFVVINCLTLSIHEITYIGNDIDKYKDKVLVEVPEMYELIYVVCALTETFQKRPYLLETETEYYKDIISYFGKFKHHPLVLKVDKKLKSKMFGRLTQKMLRFDGIRYRFDDKNRIKRTQEYRLPWISFLPVIGIKKIKSDLEDFSRTTKFREFYAEHKSYYKALIEKEKKICDFRRIWDWLENQFPDKYDSYRAIISPLTGGYHFVQRVKTDKKKRGFKQTIVYVNPPFHGDKLNFSKYSALNSRYVFTEIDHNYVNPIAEKFKKDIRTALENTGKWNKGNRGYPSKMLIFCEYMTWSVFNLYAYDTYKKETFEYINRRTENNMVDNRSFVKFNEFNRRLLELYKNRKKNQTIANLFPEIIEWMGNQ